MDVANLRHEFDVSMQKGLQKNLNLFTAEIGIVGCVLNGCRVRGFSHALEDSFKASRSLVQWNLFNVRSREFSSIQIDAFHINKAFDFRFHASRILHERSFLSCTHTHYSRQIKEALSIRKMLCETSKFFSNLLTASRHLRSQSLRKQFQLRCCFYVTKSLTANSSTC